jgi:hypothetical protein
MTTVKFTTGEEKEFDADAAVLSGPLFVLHKWNARRRKPESGACFPADQVVWARLPDGSIVLGVPKRMGKKEDRRVFGSD